MWIFAAALWQVWWVFAAGQAGMGCHHSWCEMMLHASGLVCSLSLIARLENFAGETCDCSKSGLKCFYDDSCPGLGCGAEGKDKCRFCGSGEFKNCPDHAPKTSDTKAPEDGSKEKASKPAATEGHSSDIPSVVLGGHEVKTSHAGRALSTSKLRQVKHG